MPKKLTNKQLEKRINEAIKLADRYVIQNRNLIVELATEFACTYDADVDAFKVQVEELDSANAQFQQIIITLIGRGEDHE